MKHSQPQQGSSHESSGPSVALALTLAICTGQAVAQTTDPSPAPATATRASAAALREELKWLQAERITISTASLHAESVERAPATVRVLTRRQLQERGYRTLEDVLKSLPSVDVLNHVNTDSKSVTTIRGVTGNERFIILQDGIRISGPTGGADLQISENYPLYMARQVEFLAGPASALYGADALTGVINIITDEPTREGTLRGELAGGSFQTTQLSFFSAKRFTDSVAISIGGHHQLSDGAPLSRLYPADFATLPAGAAPYSSPVRSFSTFAKVELWEHLTLGWNQSFISTSAAEAELPGTTTLYDQSPVNPTVLATAYARYKRDINERIQADVQASYTRYERLPNSGYHDVFTGYARAYNYAYGERYHFEPRVSIELDRHVLAAGLTADLTYAIPRTVDLASPYDPRKGPQQQGQNYLGSAIPAQIFDERAFNTGVFLQAQTEWSERISTTVGLRFDYNSEYGETFNPRLGLVFQQTPETTWKMLYGRSFLAPSAHLRFENYGQVAVPTTAYFFIPNPDLKPEQLQTLELSWSHRITDHTTFGVVGFYTMMSQTILPVFTAGAGNTTFIPGTTITDTEQYQNVGELQSRGVELTLDHEWKGTLSRLNLWASFTYVNGQVKDRLSSTSFDLPFTSTELLKLGATWNYNDRFIFTPTANFNGPQAGAASPDTIGFGTRTPAFFVVNLYAELRNARQNFALFVRADNLLDRRYYNAGFGGDYNFYATPQDSRTVTVGLRAGF